MSNITVYIKNQSKEEFEKMVKLFKRKCQNDGILQEIRDRRYYKKPSEIKRLKLKNALKEKNKQKRRR